MRIFESPGTFDPRKRADIEGEELTERGLQDLSGGPRRDLPRKHRKKLACHAYILCEPDVVHRVGFTKKGRFFSFNHTVPEIQADVVHVYLGGVPCGCTRIFLQLRAIFDWLSFDKDGTFTYAKETRWKAITRSGNGGQQFLHGFHPAFFTTVLKALVRKFRRHEAIVRKNVLELVEQGHELIKARKVTLAGPDGVHNALRWVDRLDDYSDTDLLDNEIAGVRKRYRHMAHMLKSTAFEEEHTDLIYRYI